MRYRQEDLEEAHQMPVFHPCPANQERELALFLDALGLALPPADPSRDDEYLVFGLDPAMAELWEANGRLAVLLGYRHQGWVYPLAIVFLKGAAGELLFCHSTLLVDCYAQGQDVLPALQDAIQRFFSRDTGRVLGSLQPAWATASPQGLLDCRIAWNAKPEMKIVCDLFREKLGQVCDIPLFPSVYYYNNPYEENLLEASLPDLAGCREALVLGVGAGLEAICIALQYGITVDATDINPLAVANTQVACRRTGTDRLVRAWVSDGFRQISKKYDAILFEAPLATAQMHLTDANRHDLGGRLLREVLAELPSHLHEGGRLYLMSVPDLAPYLSGGRLHWEVLRTFNPKVGVAIHKLWCV